MDTQHTYESGAEILIVDDKPENLRLLTEILKDKGYAVRQLRNGKMVMPSVLSAPPDLILLDIMMPETDGYDVCQQLKAQEQTRGIPVIFISALNETTDKVRAFSAGGVDYITKPFHEEEVLARVETHLSLRRLQRQLEAQNTALIEAARLREDVERITRHDLKTPLNAIICLPQIMMTEDDISEKHLENLKMIEESGLKMLNMINLSLDMFRMEQGIYQLQPVLVDVHQVIRRILNDTEFLGMRKHLSVVMHINGKPADDEDYFSVRGEELLCYSMLANLIKNAFEASPKEEQITIDLANDEDMSLIRIHNKGAVPHDIQDKFFGKYVTSGKKSGTGLGTYSARLIAETQGGSIHLETSGEKGTTVTVRLPGQHAQDMQKMFVRTDFCALPSELAAASEKKDQCLPLDAQDKIGTMPTSHRLNALPKDLFSALKTAAERTDLKRSNAAIQQIREQDEALGDALADLVRKYRFDIIQKLFEKKGETLHED